MTEPVRPLEALITEKIAEWRANAAKLMRLDMSLAAYPATLQLCADELAALLQAAAPPAPTAEQESLRLVDYDVIRLAVIEYLRFDITTREQQQRITEWAALCSAPQRAAPPAPTADSCTCWIGRGEYGGSDRHLCSIHREPIAPPAPTAEREPPAKVKQAVFLYLNTLVITSDNIGDIRRSLFMPFDCKWNGWVRDMTAELENKSSCAAPPERVSEGKRPVLRDPDGIVEHEAGSHSVRVLEAEIGELQHYIEYEHGPGVEALPYDIAVADDKAYLLKADVLKAIRPAVEPREESK